MAASRSKLGSSKAVATPARLLTKTCCPTEKFPPSAAQVPRVPFLLMNKKKKKNNNNNNNNNMEEMFDNFFACLCILVPKPGSGLML